MVIIGTSGSFLAGRVSEKGGDKPSFEAKVLFWNRRVAWHFSQKTGTKYFPQALGRAVKKKHGGQLKIFLFEPKITNQNRIHQKNTPSQRALSYFFTAEAAEVKRAGGNEKTARLDRSIRSLVTWNILEQGPRSSLFKFPLLLAWLQRLDMLSVWPLSAKQAKKVLWK